jgi:putative spermidine/putrescine transport system ATP-binding protein/spermidine/putrescine transport system ATP-binding protein
MADTVLELDRVSRSFGAVRAVEQVSLALQRRELFALLGPSGSGKTTMLRLIAGLQRPDRGRVRIDGADVTDLPPYRRRLGMVFQDFLLFPHRTVAENVVFPLRMQRLPVPERRRALDWVLALVRLQGLEARYPHELSGGQKQRVALARGLVAKPALLLLDEPLANLDRELRREMEVEIRRFQQELAIPFVYVTHNQEEALTLADRMAVMRAGRLEQVGDKLELYHRPTTPFVAGFLGAANSFEGRVLAVERSIARIDWQGHAVEARAHPGLAPGGPAVCFVKSEKIQLLTSTEDSLSGRLRDIIFKGQYADYLVDLLGGREIRVSAPPGLESLRPGAAVAVRWQAEDADAFAPGAA